jgi:hypothetical protein
MATQYRTDKSGSAHNQHSAIGRFVHAVRTTEMAASQGPWSNTIPSRANMVARREIARINGAAWFRPSYIIHVEPRDRD